MNYKTITTISAPAAKFYEKTISINIFCRTAIAIINIERTASNIKIYVQT
jgi:hypothetical protein